MSFYFIQVQVQDSEGSGEERGTEAGENAEQCCLMYYCTGYCFMKSSPDTALDKRDVS